MPAVVWVAVVGLEGVEPDGGPVTGDPLGALGPEGDVSELPAAEEPLGTGSEEGAGALSSSARALRLEMLSPSSARSAMVLPTGTF